LPSKHFCARPRSADRGRLRCLSSRPTWVRGSGPGPWALGRPRGGAHRPLFPSAPPPQGRAFGRRRTAEQRGAGLRGRHRTALPESLSTRAHAALRSPPTKKGTEDGPPAARFTPPHPAAPRGRGGMPGARGQLRTRVAHVPRRRRRYLSGQWRPDPCAPIPITAANPRAWRERPLEPPGVPEDTTRHCKRPQIGIV
jgi:hypothetical protein